MNSHATIRDPRLKTKLSWLRRRTSVSAVVPYNPSVALRWMPAVVAFASLVLAYALPEIIQWLSPWPLIIAGATYGMTHGGADWVALGWLRRREGGRTAVRTAVVYAAILVAATVAMVVLPGWSLAAFLLLTVVHFGRSEVWGTVAQGSGSRWAAPLAHGALVVATPFAFQFQPTAAVFSDALRLFSADAALPGLSVWPAVASTLWVMALAVVFVEAAALLRGDADNAGAYARLVAVVAFAGLATVAEPLFAVGLYFLAAHAFRETGRLTRRLVSPARSFAHRATRLQFSALPFSVPAWTVWTLLVTVFGDATSPRDWALALLVVFAAATWAHHWLAERMEG